VLDNIERQVGAALHSGQTAWAPGAKPPRRRRLVSVLLNAAVLFGVGWGSFTYGPTLWRFAVNQGELLVVSPDPAARVLVKQHGRTVAEATPGQAAALEPGMYEVELAGGRKGLKLSRQQFTLNRGGQVNLRVVEEPASRP